MKRALLVVVLVALLILAGCGGVLPGFRMAPAEEQKQTAQVGADLAGVAATSGLPPRSAAAAQMAHAARAGSAYAGPPSEPVDVSDLVPPAVTRAWDLMERRAEALGIRADVLDRTAEMTAEGLADLAADIEGQAKVNADRVVFRAAAIVQGQKIGAELADAIPLPDPLDMTPEEAARLKRLDAALDKLQVTAAAQAARRPTTGEVVEAAEGQALDTLDRVGQVLEDYGLLGLVPGAAGVLYAVRKRKQAKDSRADSEQAREGEKTARAEMILARDGVDAARRDADAARQEINAARREATDTARAAMEKVAETAAAAVANGLNTAPSASAGTPAQETT